MPAPIVTAALISGGSSILSSLLDRRSNRDRRSAEQKELEQLQLSNTRRLSPYGFDALDEGNRLTKDATDFWERVMKGDRQTLEEMFGSELASIGAGYDQTVRQGAELNPRSGGGAAMLASLPFAKMQDQNSLLTSFRREAPDKLGMYGAGLSSLGLSALGMSGSNAMGLLRYGQDERRNAWDRDYQEGRSLGGFLGAIPWDKIDWRSWFSRGGDTTPSGIVGLGDTSGWGSGATTTGYL